MEPTLVCAIILSIFVYFGQRIVRVLAEPDLPTQEGLFILPLECKDVKLVCSSTIPKDGALACSAGFTTNWNFLKSTETRIENSYTNDGVFHERKTDKTMGTFTFSLNELRNVNGYGAEYAV